MISTASANERRRRVLSALADGTRAQILDMVAHGPRPAGEIHRAFPIAAPAVSRHLRVLREAGLVEERHPPDDRRVRVYALRPEPIAELAEWLRSLSGAWQAQLDAFEDFVALRRARPEEER